MNTCIKVTGEKIYILNFLVAAIIMILWIPHQIHAAEDPIADSKNSIVEIYYGITTDDGVFHRIKHASGAIISNQEEKAYILTAFNSVHAGQKGKLNYCKKNNISTENNSLTDTIQIVTKGDVVAAPAQILTSSEDKNFCLLETDRGLAEKSAVKLGISQDLVSGIKVYSLGFASDAGEKDEEANRYTEFTALDVVVSEGTIQDVSANQKGVMYLQHSAAITGGNHGGALIDEKGYLVGINDAKLNDQERSAFYSLPVDEIREILDNYQVPYVSIDKEYSLENFRNLLSECQSLLASNDYKPKSKEALQEAVEYAGTVLQTNNPEEESIREASDKLKEAKTLLAAKMKTSRKIIIVLGFVIAILLIILIRLLLWKRSYRKNKKKRGNSRTLDEISPSEPIVRKRRTESFPENRLNADEAENNQKKNKQMSQKDLTYDTNNFRSSSAKKGRHEADLYEGTVHLPDFYQRKEQAVLYCVSMGQRKVIDKARFTIGKREDNDLSILNSAVSRKHACIIWEKSHYYIEDLNSSNGTLVNGIEVKPGARFELKNGSQIMLADEKLIFEVMKRTERKRKSS